MALPFAVAAFVGAWALVLGVAYGALAGYPSGRRAGFWRRSALVLCPIAFVLAPAAIVLALVGREPAQLLVVAGAIGWAAAALVVGRAARALSRREFVDAARLAGVPPWTLVRRHVLPNLARAIAVAAAFAAVQALVVVLALYAVRSMAPPAVARGPSLLVSSCPA
jgi:oligopeptide transport system permease protein